MWDSKAPLQLLKDMPKKLTMENLEKIQQVIDADKYKNSLISGFDLCGMYAPFCRDCRKTSIYPCALSYIKMLQADGMDVTIDARPVENKKAQPAAKAEKEENTETAVRAEKAVESKSADVAADVAESEAAITSAVETEEITDSVPVEAAPAEVREKRKIRIAVARKKITD
ncbi:MAG TPA: hypothetical protein DD415_02745 [Clostridiales bacterium]|nr:hypothetical protein [Clostridiales bacterium]